MTAQQSRFPMRGGGLLWQQALMSPWSTGVGAGKGSGHEGGARGKGCWWRGQHKQRQAAGQQESVPRLLSISFCSKGVQGVPPGHLCTSGRERQKADGILKAPSPLSGNASDDKVFVHLLKEHLPQACPVPDPQGWGTHSSALRELQSNGEGRWADDSECQGASGRKCLCSSCTQREGARGRQAMRAESCGVRKSAASTQGPQRSDPCPPPHRHPQLHLWPPNQVQPHHPVFSQGHRQGGH